MISTRKNIVGRFFLIVMLLASLTAPARGADCEEDCAGMCCARSRDGQVREGPTRGSDGGHCCPADGSQNPPCCSITSEIPETPTFLMTHLELDPDPSMGFIRIADECDICHRPRVSSICGVAADTARPSPIYILNLSILC